MAELKPGWQRVKFGDVAECINDRVDNPAEAGVDRYVGLEHLDPETLKICRWGSPDDVASTKLMFKPGDIVFAKRRAYQRKLAVADFEGICSAHAMVLRAKSAIVRPDFLAFFMQSDLFMERAVEISVGSLSPTINWKTLAQQEFEIPPLEEQRRIASALHALSGLTDALDSVISTSKQVENAIVQRAIQAFADAHPVRPLGSVCKRVTDGTHQPPTFTQSGVPFFLVKTISGGDVDWRHTKFVSHKTYTELTRNIRPCRGHVLYTAVGATYGVAKLVDFDGPFVFQRHIAHIIPEETLLLGEYIELFLNSPIGRRLSDKHAIGSAQPTVTLRSLSSFPIPCPPIEEQEKLVKQVAEIRSSKYRAHRRLGQARSGLLVATREIAL